MLPAPAPTIGREPKLTAIGGRLRALDGAKRRGSVVRIRGAEVEIRGLSAAVSDMVEIHGASGVVPGQVIGVTPSSLVVALFGAVDGIRRGDLVAPRPDARPRMGPDLIGRVVDGLGRPIDGGPELAGVSTFVDGTTPSPLLRARVQEPLATGVRVLDLMVPAAKGQRLGIFGGSGVGKSTLLGMMARGTEAQINVIALIGERGREVRELIEDDLGPEGLAKSIVVVATSDQPAIMRRRAADLAVAYSEFFADAGADVLLMFDSLTRLAMAQRELGLAAGEPPTARGYTPSVFSLLPALLERTGPRATGSITGFFTVLVDGDDMNDPIADAARSILDGHVVLDRRLAHRNQYPAVDPLASLSRLANVVSTPEDAEAAGLLRSALAAVEEVRDLVEVGAYSPGSNPRADAGLAVEQDIWNLLGQRPDETTTADDARAAARALVGGVA